MCNKNAQFSILNFFLLSNPPAPSTKSKFIYVCFWTFVSVNYPRRFDFFLCAYVSSFLNIMMTTLLNLLDISFHIFLRCLAEHYWYFAYFQGKNTIKNNYKLLMFFQSYKHMLYLDCDPQYLHQVVLMQSR